MQVIIWWASIIFIAFYKRQFRNVIILILSLILMYNPLVNVTTDSIIFSRNIHQHGSVVPWRIKDIHWEIKFEEKNSTKDDLASLSLWLFM